MIQRMRSNLRIEVSGASLDGATNLEFYIRQWGGIYIELTPTVVDDTHIDVAIKYEDAMKLEPTQAQLQLAFTDSNGQACATEVLTVSVTELLKEAGYAH